MSWQSVLNDVSTTETREGTIVVRESLVPALESKPKYYDGPEEVVADRPGCQQNGRDA